eukprot:1754697-Pyramimonas_sp.AAC.1
MPKVERIGDPTESAPYSFPPMRALTFPPPFANIMSDVRNRTTDLWTGDFRQDLGHRGHKSPRSETQNTNIEDLT